MGICSMEPVSGVAPHRTTSTPATVAATASSAAAAAGAPTVASTTSTAPLHIIINSAAAATTGSNSSNSSKHADAARVDAGDAFRKRLDTASTTAPALVERSPRATSREAGASQSEGEVAASLSSSSSFSSSSDDDDDDEEAAACSDGSPRGYLLKPMPTLLPVCPVDDLALEDEKRRRRHAHAHAHAHALSPERLKHKKRELAAERQPAARPLLRRDSMAIRQQYWKQLGLPVTRSALERSAGRRPARLAGLKVRLNDAPRKAGGSGGTSLLQLLSRWYSSSPPKESVSESETETETDSSSSGSTKSTTTVSTSTRRGVRFLDEAELFYIPLHSDYSKRQRECMWHSRVEFVAMVERNLEDVYDEMEREYEEQLAAEAAENAAMAREEARQRRVESAREASAAAAAAAAAAVASARPAAVPTLALCPTETTIRLAPRGRSPHDIRFKYLKHLGIGAKNS